MFLRCSDKFYFCNIKRIYFDAMGLAVIYSIKNKPKFSIPEFFYYSMDLLLIELIIYLSYFNIM